MKKFFEEGSIELVEIHELLDKLYRSTLGDHHHHNPVARSLGCADRDFGYTVYLLRTHVKALEEAVALYDKKGCDEV